MSSKPVTKTTKPEIVSTPDPRVVSLDGELTLRRAERIRTELLAAIDAGDPVRIELDGATEADVAFVQVLLAAGRAASRHGRPLQITGLAGGPMPPLLAALGLIRPGEDAETFLTQPEINEVAA